MKFTRSNSGLTSDVGKMLAEAFNAKGKAEALTSVGAHVVNRPWDLIPVLKDVFNVEEDK